MDAKDVVYIVSIFGSILYAVREFYWLKWSVDQMRREIALDRQETDAVISFLRQRAINAGKHKNRLEENSPLKITERYGAETRVLYRPILDDLRRTYGGLYQQFGVHMTDNQLWIAIQTQFGEWLSKNVCLQASPVMEFGECIELVIILAKEG